MNKAGMGDRSSDSLGLDLRSRRSTNNDPLRTGLPSTSFSFIAKHTLLFLPPSRAGIFHTQDCTNALLRAPLLVSIAGGR